MSQVSNASFMSLWYLFYQSKGQPLPLSEVKCCTTFSSQERDTLRDFHVSENMQLRTSMSKKLKGSQRTYSHVRSTSAIIARSAITRTTLSLSVFLPSLHAPVISSCRMYSRNSVNVGGSPPPSPSSSLFLLFSCDDPVRASLTLCNLCVKTLQNNE